MSVVRLTGWGKCARQSEKNFQFSNRHIHQQLLGAVTSQRDDGLEQKFGTI
jgi:hypothetical protein